MSVFPARTSFEQRMARYWVVINAEKEAERIVNQRYDNADISTENAIAPPRRHKKKKHKLDPKLRLEILERDGNKCVECGSEEFLNIHHKVPREDGGTDEPDNLQTLCEICHAEKHKDKRIYKVMQKRIRSRLK